MSTLEHALARVVGCIVIVPAVVCARPAIPVVAVASAWDQQDAGTVQAFELSQVRLLDGPFRHAQDLGLQYLRALETDRLLAGFRIEAGLEPQAARYPNWESTGLDRHTAGHYLTALAQMWAATGDAETRRRLDYMVAELAECQLANGDGCVGAVPGGRQLWSAIAAGRIEARPFELNGSWVP